VLLREFKGANKAEREMELNAYGTHVENCSNRVMVVETETEVEMETETVVKKEREKQRET
jgi:hypothetical protein